jgi:hypothetical protein
MSWQLKSEHYLKALVVVASVYMGVFVYLELSTVVKEDLIQGEELYEVQLEQLDEAQKIEMREEMNLQQAQEMRSIARDLNDARPASEQDWSTQVAGQGQANPEQSARDYEAQVFAETGGEAARAQIRQQSQARIQQLKQQGQPQSSNPSPASGSPNQYAGAVMVDFSVTGRSAYERNTWYVRNPGYTCGFNAAGTVYIEIEVAGSGRVSSAQYIAAKSSNASPCMIEQALKYAKMSRFTDGSSAAKGYIKYRFEAQ